MAKSPQPAGLPPALDRHLEQLVFQVHHVAAAITPPETAPDCDATGGHVGCLTEAVMGTTAALVRIATALQNIADAIHSVADNMPDPRQE